MRKSVIALATVLALGNLSFAADALARGGHGGSGHFGGGHHFGGRHFGGGHFAGRRFGGHRFGHGRFVGHHRHFWHGRWWDYGVGPCWVWSDVYAEYVWVCY